MFWNHVWRRTDELSCRNLWPNFLLLLPSPFCHLSEYHNLNGDSNYTVLGHVVLAFNFVFLIYCLFAVKEQSYSEMKQTLNQWLRPEIWMYKEEKEKDHYLSYVFSILNLSGLLWILYFASLGRSGSLKAFAKDIGVSLKRVR